jgi:undecaprenyl-diphosphatase
MELTALQYIFLGIIQGITEWLPISSSGMITLILSNFYSITDVGVIIRTALFLHLGTFLAALIYFKKPVWKLTKTIFNYKKQDNETKKIFNFILISTIITGVIGLAIIKLFSSLNNLEITGKTVSLVVGILLLITGIIQIKTKRSGIRKERNLKNRDGIYLGIFQGLATFPGLSRSGITVSTLLLRKFDDTSALRLSFLMSLPIVLIGNIILNLEDFIFSTTALWALLASFVFGLITIHGMIKLSKKINFGWFIAIFAMLMVISVLV